MSRRPSGLSIRDQDETEAMQSSMEITIGGSIYYKGYRIGRQGVMQAPDLHAGKVSEINDLSELRFKEELGRGASSTVWKAELFNSNKRFIVAVKELQLKRELLHQFGKELDSLLLPRLKENKSVHVVSIYDAFFDRDGDKLYIGLSSNPSLHFERVFMEQTLSVIMLQILRGLAFLFDLGIQHRDLKPANILLTRGGHVKITDFGSSKAASGPAQGGDGGYEPLAETFCGTTRYMSPERLNGCGYSWPADVWSAGIIMLEIAMGEHPYKVLYGEDSSFPALLDYTTRRDIPKLDPARFSEDAQDLVACCLHKDPSQRTAPSLLVPMGDEDDMSSGDGHPFIMDYIHLPPAAVACWVGID